MMLTQEAVIAHLADRRYEITPLRLVDWREKALLPPLSKQPRAGGKGWHYGWEEPRIVEQVIAVQELLWIHERTQWLYVPLWCLGFDVPLDKVKSQLDATLDRQRAFLTGGGQDRDELAFRLSALATTEVTRPGPRRGRSQESADLLEYCLTLLAGDTAYVPEREVWSQVAAAVAALAGSAAQELTGTGNHLWTPAGLWRIHRWSQRFVSFPRLEAAAPNATAADWAAVHADWLALARLVDKIGQYAEEDVWEGFYPLWMRGVAVVGPWMSLVELAMRRRGQGRVWDGIRHELISTRERLEQDIELQVQMRHLWAETSISKCVDSEVNGA